MNKNPNDKNVSRQRHRLTKTERQYIQGIVHNLTMQRMTDQEIVQWLHDEKKIDVARSTVTTIKNQVEKQAEGWYMDLRNSATKYVAYYKERIDSLFSYQKKLNEIVSQRYDAYPEIAVRAIAELHRIEMSIVSLFKELPQFNIEPTPNNTRALEGCICRSTGTITHSKCLYCQQVWCPTTLNQDWCPNPDCSHGIKGCKFSPWDEHFDWVQCSICEMWFKTPEILAVHPCHHIKLDPKPIEVSTTNVGITEQEQESEQEEPTLIEEPSFTPVTVVEEQIKQEEEESEVDRYWRTHKPKYRPSGNGVTYTPR